MTLYDFLSILQVHAGQFGGVILSVDGLDNGVVIYHGPIENLTSYLAEDTDKFCPAKFVSMGTLYHGELGQLLDMKVVNWSVDVARGIARDSRTFEPRDDGPVWAMVLRIDLDEVDDANDNK